MNHAADAQGHRMPRLAWLALALSCVVTLARSSEAQSANDTRGILFSVRDYQRSGVVVSSAGERVRILVEPIAFVSGGILTKLPDEPDLDAFARDYYPKDRSYDLIAAGRVAGKVKIDDSAFDVQCESLAARGTVIPGDTVSGMRMALASNVSFRDPHLTRRAATSDERAKIVGIAQEVYRENGVAPDVAKRAEARNVTVFERADQALLIASFEAEELRHEGGFDADYVNAVFVIAEREGDGAYSVTHKWFHSGSDNTLETQDLVDVLDLVGTGSIDVVTQFGYYEAVEYHIYRRKGEQWQDFYQQFGGGC
jgi:hypothetical protein